MRWAPAVTIVLLALAGSCRRNAGVEHVSAGSAACSVARADPGRQRIAMAWKRADGSAYRTIAALRREHPEAELATNGGIFGKDSAPLGLYVEDGKEIVPLNVGEGEGNFHLKPNGVFVVADDGKASVAETSAFAKAGVRFAVQSGPMLVIKGKVNAAFDPNSNNRRVRSGVGVRADGVVCFAMSEGFVSFHEFAVLFRDGLECPNALFLDGDLSQMSPPDVGDGHDVATIIWVAGK